MNMGGANGKKCCRLCVCAAAADDDNGGSGGGGGVRHDETMLRFFYPSAGRINHCYSFIRI